MSRKGIKRQQKIIHLVCCLLSIIYWISFLVGIQPSRTEKKPEFISFSYHLDIHHENIPVICIHYAYIYVDVDKTVFYQAYQVPMVQFLQLIRL